MTRRATHKWGKMNRVTFDGEKEHIIILHPIHGEGDSFKLLGCLMDCKLQMLQAIDAILARMRPKVTAILRLRSHYGPHALIDQFKTHVWGFLECHNGAIFHAAPSYLAKFDRLQEKFLQEINMDEASDFLNATLLHLLYVAILEYSVSYKKEFWERHIPSSRNCFHIIVMFLDHYDRTSIRNSYTATPWTLMGNTCYIDGVSLVWCLFIIVFLSLS